MNENRGFLVKQTLSWNVIKYDVLTDEKLDIELKYYF